MSLPLENVREELLRAGVAPYYVRRYLSELRDHLTDLMEHERAAGRDMPSARERAHELLGTESQLVQAAIQSAPRSLAARAPWAVFAVLPVLIFIGFFVAIVYSMFRLLEPVHASWPGGIPNSYTGLITTASIVTNYLLGPACAAGSIAIALRQRLLSGWVWVGLGVTALFSGLLGFHMTVLSPIAGVARGPVFSVVPAVYVNGEVSRSATFALAAVRAATLFLTAGVTYGLVRRRLPASPADPRDGGFRLTAP